MVVETFKYALRTCYLSAISLGNLLCGVVHVCPRDAYNLTAGADGGAVVVLVVVN